jgi:hypothetical protein
MTGVNRVRSQISCGKALSRHMAKQPKLSKKRLARLQRKFGGRADLGYAHMHIPKTGGTAYSDLSAAIAEQGYAMPLKLGHAWTFERAIGSVPELRLCTLIRDPLERTVSSFNSRLRQGRPKYRSMWTVEEAAAFSIFPDVRAFLDALVSDGHFEISATEFAFRNISHLRRGYAFYFKSPDYLEAHKDRLAFVADTAHSMDLWKRLGAMSRVPEDLIESNFVRSHVAPVATIDALSKYSSSEIGAMRGRLAREYAIYDILKSLVNVPSASNDIEDGLKGVAKDGRAAIRSIP